MWLLGIDDVMFDDIGIRPALITDQSTRLSFATKRRDGTASSIFFSSAPQPAAYDVLIKLPDLAARDAVLAALGGNFEEEVRLLAKRDRAGDVLVTTKAAVTDIEERSELTLEVKLEASDSLWLGLTGDTATGTLASLLDMSVPLVVRGNAPAPMVVSIAPQAQRTTKTAFVGWQWRRRYTITNGSDEPIFAYPVRIDLGDTATVVTAGKALSSGNDLRVWIEGVEQARTLVGWNTSSTGVWVVVPTIAAGDTLVIDVVYGNAAAGTAPGLAYPDLPAFDLATSTNLKWIYLVNAVIANAGLGLWNLSRGSFGATADFGVPGAWRPMLTLDNPGNQDEKGQNRYQPLPATSPTFVMALFSAARAPAGSPIDTTAASNPYDGVGVHNPFGIVSLRAGFLTVSAHASGAASPGKLVVLVRNSAADSWDTLATPATATATVAVTTYTPASPVKHVATAVWPANNIDMPVADDVSTSDPTYFAAQSNLTWELNLDTSTKLGIAQTTSEEQIYELATEVRLDGGDDYTPPYRALRIGNARSESGPGTPRAALTLAQALKIDTDRRRHEIWTSDLKTKVEDLSTHAIRAVVGVDDDGATSEFRTSAWIPVAPPRTRLPNGSFDADLGGWLITDATSGVTAALSHDDTVGDAQLGAGKLAVTANSAGVNATVTLRNNRFFLVNDREAVNVALSARVSSLNLRPVPAVFWYDDASDVAIVTAMAATWTPAAINTWYRRLFAERCPENATRYQVGCVLALATAGATGTAWMDDVSVNDNELIVADVSPAALAIRATVLPRWV